MGSRESKAITSACWAFLRMIQNWLLNEILKTEPPFDHSDSAVFSCPNITESHDFPNASGRFRGCKLLSQNNNSREVE
jgi:hypothetical protein